MLLASTVKITLSLDVPQVPGAAPCLAEGEGLQGPGEAACRLVLQPRRGMWACLEHQDQTGHQARHQNVGSRMTDTLSAFIVLSLASDTKWTLNRYLLNEWMNQPINVKSLSNNIIVSDIRMHLRVWEALEGLSKHRLLGPELRIQHTGDEAWEFAFPASSQGMLMQLVWDHTLRATDLEETVSIIGRPAPCSNFWVNTLTLRLLQNKKQKNTQAEESKTGLRLNFLLLSVGDVESQI